MYLSTQSTVFDWSRDCARRLTAQVLRRRVPRPDPEVSEGNVNLFILHLTCVYHYRYVTSPKVSVVGLYFRKRIQRTGGRNPVTRRDTGDGRVKEREISFLMYDVSGSYPHPPLSSGSVDGYDNYKTPTPSLILCPFLPSPFLLVLLPVPFYCSCDRFVLAF